MIELPNLARRACLTECTARKPGNVYPGANFDDLTHAHFVTAAGVAAETLPAAATIGVGPAVLNCVRETRRECGTNVNLGIALLLAPLCATPPRRSPAATLAATTVDDAVAVYEAIRLANPGGLGDAAEQDVRSEPTVTLLETMRLAADRDGVAKAWATDFNGVWCDVVGLEHVFNQAPRTHRLAWEDATLLIYLSRLRTTPDTHIARRCGEGAAIAIRDAVRERHQPHRPDDGPLAERPWVRTLDGLLRTGRPRRNPGTTADLTCAALFWAARDGRIELPTEEELAAQAAHLVREANRR
ncbi:triphosphoribosyl-dephospho-CoA synthase [Alienimonas chondri]|uniref:triphosphoribosyl-dephospho-CoA synthase n=1 Tax=Alienimonas chondri TaxID=2681879 RepID=UPI0014891A12|nr:triphosphoribosyl-dephospho-CoA synthase [Alienimonas chondri]